MRKFAMLLTALLALIGFTTPALAEEVKVEILSLQAHPSDVDIGKPKTWVKPNVDPYSGDIDNAAFLGKVTDIRPLELKEAWAMRTRGECHRYQFGQKDVFRTTFGTNRSMLAKPGFTGMADVCIVRADGTAVVFPDDCKNIGPALATVRREEKHQEPEKREATRVVITTTVAPRASEGNSVVTPLFLGVPGAVYGGGSTNISVGSRSTSTSSASTDGTCKAGCAPKH